MPPNLPVAQIFFSDDYMLFCLWVRNLKIHRRTRENVRDTFKNTHIDQFQEERCSLIIEKKKVEIGAYLAKSVD